MWFKKVLLNLLIIGSVLGKNLRIPQEVKKDLPKEEEKSIIK